MSTLVQLWEQSERSCADKIAVVCDDRRLTYRQLGDSIRRLAGLLQRRWHVRPGDVVALFSPNCAEFVISYFAIVSLGATVQPLDERLNAAELKLILTDAGARFAIVHHSLWPKLKPIRDELSTLRNVLGIGFAEVDVARYESVDGEPDTWVVERTPSPATVAELMYTSGTTGSPKGVMRSHRNVRAAARNAIIGFGYRADDVIAIVMPMSHSSALNSQMVPLLQLGGRLILLAHFDAGSLIHLIRHERVTCMRAVPTMLRLLLAMPAFCQSELPSLRLLMNSSGPIDPATFVALKQRFPHVHVLNSYGLTEASTCTVLPDWAVLQHSDSIGFPIRGVEMAVLDGAGHPLADDCEGEIAIRGEHVFAGYWNRCAESRAAFVNGWLKTRDLGHRDRNGLYYLHGRVDDAINCGGHKFAPMEVEHCILQLPEVAEVVVVGEPHVLLGQVAKAFVVPRDHQQADRKAIVRHCAQHLSSYKVPFHVEFVVELPRNSVGKVLRYKLKGE